MRSKPTYWDKIRKELRPKFEAAGILNVCELNWENCLANKHGIVPKTYQTFAHSLRRKKIDSYKKNDREEYERLMREVIRACVKCHSELDNELEDDKTHEKARDIVRDTIKNRKKPLV